MSVTAWNVATMMITLTNRTLRTLRPFKSRISRRSAYSPVCSGFRIRAPIRLAANGASHDQLSVENTSPWWIIDSIRIIAISRNIIRVHLLQEYPLQ